MTASTSSLTAELGDQLTALLRAGNYITVACDAVGITRRTYSRWMKRGLSDAAPDAPYRAFRAAVERARAEAEAIAVTQVAKAAASDWRAAAWFLERGFPERWGRASDRVPPPVETAATHDEDPFAEADELADRRRNRAG